MWDGANQPPLSHFGSSVAVLMSELLWHHRLAEVRCVGEMPCTVYWILVVPETLVMKLCFPAMFDAHFPGAPKPSGGNTDFHTAHTAHSGAVLDNQGSCTAAV